MIPVEQEPPTIARFQKNADALEQKPTFQQNNFNLMRVVLAISVIFSHCYPIKYGLEVLDPTAHFLRDQKDLPMDHAIDLGHLAVYGFFVISGYLVTMSWQRSLGIWDYLKKRILRIYPGFVIVSLLCALIVGPLAADNTAAYWHQLGTEGLTFFPRLILLDLTVPPVFIHMPVSGAMNGSLWTIPFEFQCYLLVVLLGLASLRASRFIPSNIRRALPATLFAGAYLAYFLYCSGSLAAMPGLLRLNEFSFAGRILTKIGASHGLGSRMYLYFISGMCLYLYRRIIPFRLPLAIVALAALLASIYVLPVIAYVLPLAGSYLLLYIAFLPSPFSRVGTKHDLSYGLYLYAFPVQQLLVHYFDAQLSIAALFFSALIVTAGLAFLSWKFIEAPSLRLKNKKPSPAVS